MHGVLWDKMEGTIPITHEPWYIMAWNVHFIFSMKWRGGGIFPRILNQFIRGNMQTPISIYINCNWLKFVNGLILTQWYTFLSMALKFAEKNHKTYTLFQVKNKVHTRSNFTKQKMLAMMQVTVPFFIMTKHLFQ